MVDAVMKKPRSSQQNAHAPFGLNPALMRQRLIPQSKNGVPHNGWISKRISGDCGIQKYECLYNVAICQDAGGILQHLRSTACTQLLAHQ